ncbi:MAG: cyclic beta 1-2 glucan synthetase, partial [Geminicoccaceae bacterium]|nr:cyclic beta 1-2 glucan synthetase [Geminicoccaceae bacterium]
RKEFFGMGRITSPDALKRHKLSDSVGAGFDPCAAVQTSIILAPGEEMQVVFLFGMGKDEKQAVDMANRYRNIEAACSALEKAKEFWDRRLGTVRVDTPDGSMNYMLNGWLLYQVVSCRIWARSAFYQSGGAYGFRDQLQDSLSTAHLWPELPKNQIALHARHQFPEGDVQHWWHEPDGKGTRTRFSDDLLWLPYV